LAASHASPYFETSIVPFNTSLNWGADHNIEFDLAQDEDGTTILVGVATRAIAKGEELFQEYGESAAELVFRFGFLPQLRNGQLVPLEGDSVQIELALLAQACGTSIDAVKGRVAALRKANILGESPWVGVEAITAELCRVNALAACDDGGAANLVGACLALSADNKSWTKARKAMNMVKDGGDADDVMSAAMLAVLLGVDVTPLQAIATDAGRAEVDPWPLLLKQALSSSPPLVLVGAVRAAERAVEARLSLLNAKEVPCPTTSEQEEESKLLLQAWKLGQGLRSVERALLEEKREFLAGVIPRPGGRIAARTRRSRKK
jgi:hypothetical protein